MSLLLSQVYCEVYLHISNAFKTLLRHALVHLSALYQTFKLLEYKY